MRVATYSAIAMLTLACDRIETDTIEQKAVYSTATWGEVDFCEGHLTPESCGHKFAQVVPDVTEVTCAPFTLLGIRYWISSVEMRVPQLLGVGTGSRKDIVTVATWLNQATVGRIAGMHYYRNGVHVGSPGLNGQGTMPATKEGAYMGVLMLASPRMHELITHHIKNCALMSEEPGAIAQEIGYTGHDFACDLCWMGAGLITGGLQGAITLGFGMAALPAGPAAAVVAASLGASLAGASAFHLDRKLELACQNECSEQDCNNAYDSCVGPGAHLPSFAGANLDCLDRLTCCKCALLHMRNSWQCQRPTLYTVPRCDALTLRPKPGQGR